MSIVAFTGVAGSGKDTAADVLTKSLGYEKLSFAGPLKDTLSAIFGWSRADLEGTSLETRKWREEKDEWWSSALKRSVTPRGMLQEWGTEVGRNSFHPDIWVLSLMRKIQQNPGKKYVISDCRFENEAVTIKRLGGVLINIKREDSGLNFPVVGSSTHSSENGVYPQLINAVIVNDGSLADFKEKVLQTAVTLGLFP
jgi:hypothetical protein